MTWHNLQLALATSLLHNIRHFVNIHWENLLNCSLTLVAYPFSFSLGKETIDQLSFLCFALFCFALHSFASVFFFFFFFVCFFVVVFLFVCFF